MAEVEVAGVGQEQNSDQPVLLLRERAGARRYVAIWVGGPEASALAVATSGASMPRPVTHRLLLDTIDAFGAQLVRVQVIELVKSQFHAQLQLITRDGTPIAVPARASDAVTLAVHQRCPIDVAEAVLAEAALPAGAVSTNEGPTGRDAPADIEDEVERLRDALSEATPEDFRAEGEEEGGAEDR